MKVEVKNNAVNVEKTKYPWIGICPCNTNNITIVLFSSKNSGICIQGKDHDHKVGTYLSEWLESKFKPFNGTITLSND